ncbi:type II toxin-antitoxin system HicB family antitoxin (plasmid) [Acaryochloris sp. 'Moss Beach']|uniref:type II toxin-antitoxin system HicB family antitoxin n=1 Tax=Acaryochloris sp. 'Moss Beach' TaxID=2740837 RepID=UPI001F367185|nr:type II toxin-antitoxin system HicB family antitoxin [Acaryochloris sp. 'Moss Beach']UJB72371.1 type II toxin-antitoxin system HicB family antitoxin [Acaryochloris sp. 'Moss Beach']
MKNMIEYQGYFGSVHFSNEDEVFYGKVEFIRSLISYEGTDVQSLKSAFQEAIDEYLTDCAENAIEPEHSFKGSFNIRPGTQLHRQAAIAAQQRGINLNALVTEALENYLQPSK